MFLLLISAALGRIWISSSRFTSFKLLFVVVFAIKLSRVSATTTTKYHRRQPPIPATQATKPHLYLESTSASVIQSINSACHLFRKQYKPLFACLPALRTHQISLAWFTSQRTGVPCFHSHSLGPVLPLYSFAGYTLLFLSQPQQDRQALPVQPNLREKERL